MDLVRTLGTACILWTRINQYGGFESLLYEEDLNLNKKKNSRMQYDAFIALSLYFCQEYLWHAATEEWGRV